MAQFDNTDPWDEIERQQQRATDLALDEPAQLWTEIGTDFFETIYHESGGGGSKRKHPLSYYTKACGWASDYPLMYRRVMGFFNPLSKEFQSRSLDEYILYEFGCRQETLEKMIADGWFIPLLADPEAYPSDSKQAIKNLFENIDVHEYDVAPRFVNLVDFAVGARVAEDPASNIDPEAKYEFTADGERVDIDATVDAWLNEKNPLPDHDRWAGWHEIPDDEIGELYGELYGVTANTKLNSYVTEFAVKLELLADAGVFSEGEIQNVENIANNAQRVVDAEKASHGQNASLIELKQQLIETTYLNWNQLGTPAYYCDLSGSVDFGPEPLKQSLIRRLDRFFHRLSDEIKSEVGSTLPDVSFQTAGEQTMPSRPIPLQRSNEYRLNEIFKVGPERNGLDGWASRVDDRAEAFDAYYDELLAGGDGTLHQNVIDNSVSSYQTMLDKHVANADTRRFLQLIGLDISDLLDIHGTYHFIGNLSDHRDMLEQATNLADVSEAVNSAELLDLSGNPVLSGLADAVIQLPEYQLEAGGNVDIGPPLSRNDVRYGDVWSVPYETTDVQLSRAKYASVETIKNTINPIPSLPDRTLREILHRI